MKIPSQKLNKIIGQNLNFITLLNHILYHFNFSMNLNSGTFFFSPEVLIRLGFVTSICNNPDSDVFRNGFTLNRQ